MSDEYDHKRRLENLQKRILQKDENGKRAKATLEELINLERQDQARRKRAADETNADVQRKCDEAIKRANQVWRERESDWQASQKAREDRLIEGTVQVLESLYDKKIVKLKMLIWSMGSLCVLSLASMLILLIVVLADDNDSQRESIQWIESTPTWRSPK